MANKTANLVEALGVVRSRFVDGLQQVDEELRSLTTAVAESLEQVDDQISTRAVALLEEHATTARSRIGEAVDTADRSIAARIEHAEHAGGQL